MVADIRINLLLLNESVVIFNQIDLLMGDATVKDDECNNGTQELNYYEILGCSEDAPIKELKHSYQQLIKKYHPDKHEGSSELSDQFILIDKAFKTLKDEKLRKEYDALLLENSFKESCLIYAELSKSDLKFDEDGVAYFSCRCGDKFRIEQEYLEQEECIIECSECTNCILIR